MDTTFTVGDEINVSFRVKNVGNMKGKETPMLFVKDCISSVVTPVALLKEFTKVELEPGEEKTIHFTIPSSNLGLWNEDMKYVYLGRCTIVCPYIHPWSKFSSPVFLCS